MSKPINDGGPAFACASKHFNQDGMSLRAYFAGQAMQGWLARYCQFDDVHPASQDCEQSVAEFSVKMADALIAELGKEQA